MGAIMFNMSDLSPENQRRAEALAAEGYEVLGVLSVPKIPAYAYNLPNWLVEAGYSAEAEQANARVARQTHLLERPPFIVSGSPAYSEAGG